jgi:excisionase family DNA binding protein
LPSFMTPKEVAATLAVPVRSVYRLLKKRALKGLRIGRLIRVAPEELDAFIQLNDGTEPDHR